MKNHIDGKGTVSAEQPGTESGERLQGGLSNLVRTRHRIAAILRSRFSVKLANFSGKLPCQKASAHTRAWSVVPSTSCHRRFVQRSATILTLSKARVSSSSSIENCSGPFDRRRKRLVALTALVQGIPCRSELQNLKSKQLSGAKRLAIARDTSKADGDNLSCKKESPLCFLLAWVLFQSSSAPASFSAALQWGNILCLIIN